MKLLSAALAPVVSALPTASSELAGAIMRLSTDNKPYWCNGTAWVDMTLAGSVVTVSTTAPSSPSVNDLWLDIS